LRFVLDENTQKKNSKLPDNVLNAHDLFTQNGFGKFGIADKILLKLCQEKKMIIVTKDRALIIKANQKNQNIIYTTDGENPKWIFLSKNLKIENRGKLKKIIEQAVKENPNDRVVVILETTVTKPRGRIPMDDDNVYDDGEIVFSNSLLGHDVFVVGFSTVGEEKAVELRKRLVMARIARV